MTKAKTVTGIHPGRVAIRGFTFALPDELVEDLEVGAVLKVCVVLRTDRAAQRVSGRSDDRQPVWEARVLEVMAVHE